MTRQQATLLQFIEAYMDEHAGRAPSFDEMASALGLKAKSGIHKILRGLEERGFIVRRPRAARSIMIRRPRGGRNAAEALHDLVTRICEEDGPRIAFAALCDLALGIAPLLSQDGAEPQSIDSMLPMVHP